MQARAQPIGHLAGSRSAKILCVDPKVAPQLWRHVEPLLAPAFDHASDATIEVIEADLASGMQLLWVAWDGARIVAAATTALNQTPRHKLCIVTAAGGVHLKLWDQFMPMVEAYAKAEGCARVRVMGRKGWAGVLRGYSQPWVVLDKVI